jgi:hypothetical protein
MFPEENAPANVQARLPRMDERSFREMLRSLGEPRLLIANEDGGRLFEFFFERLDGLGGIVAVDEAVIERG